jgi:hypothetical protein
MSRYMPYQPMGQKPLVPESRMEEILAKHSPKAVQSPKEKSSALRQLDGELWLAKRFTELRKADLFDGTTDTALRCQRVRAAIKQHGLEVVIVGSKKGKPMTWRDAFEALYGEPL